MEQTIEPVPFEVLEQQMLEQIRLARQEEQLNKLYVAGAVIDLTYRICKTPEYCISFKMWVKGKPDLILKLPKYLSANDSETFMQNFINRYFHDDLVFTEPGVMFSDENDEIRYKFEKIDHSKNPEVMMLYLMYLKNEAHALDGMITPTEQMDTLNKYGIYQIFLSDKYGNFTVDAEQRLDPIQSH